MARVERRRRLALLACLACLSIATAVYHARQDHAVVPATDNHHTTATTQAAPSDGLTNGGDAVTALGKLAVKGRAPKTGYARSQFGDGWADLGACDVRNHVLARDMTEVRYRSATDCTVMSGRLLDPYTGHDILFARGPSTSSAVQIDHVVALSDAWQKGAQNLSATQREQLANDPLELLAVDGPANQDKSDGDAATWLPPNKDYRCRYVARQIAVKTKYSLWITGAEQAAMSRVLAGCSGQALPSIQP